MLAVGTELSSFHIHAFDCENIILVFQWTFTLPYFVKRKQVTEVTLPVKEQNVSVIYTDISDVS